MSASSWLQVGDEIRLNLVLILVAALLPIAGAVSEDGMTVVPAQEILDKIERGLPIEYDHVIIKGDLDLSKLDLPKRHVNRTDDEINWGHLTENATIVSSFLRLNDSIIDGNAYFNNTIFDNPVIFWRFSFNGTANFGGSAFNGTAEFGYSTFNRSADFRGLAFNGTAYFGASAFRGLAEFEGSAFNGPVYFSDSTFNRSADFKGTAFNGPVYFSDSTFNRSADFRGTAFNGPASFMKSAFNGDADFRGSAFNGDAYFSDSTFSGPVYFEGSAFSAPAYFYNSTFGGPADFRRSAFNGSDFSWIQFEKLVSFDDVWFNGSASFNSSRFQEDALFEGADFNGTLYLTRAKYDKLYISWKNIKELGYDDAAYLSLLENFKKLGYLEDYDGCYYEYRRAHRDQDWSGKYHAMHPAEEWLRKSIDVGLEAFYGYSKKPIRPLLWSAGTILLFWLFWCMCGLKRVRSVNQRFIFKRYGLQEPSGCPLHWGWKSELGAFADALIFSATLFLSGARLFVDPPQMPQMHRWLSLAKAAFIAERVLGAFFSILFFLAISMTVVR